MSEQLGQVVPAHRMGILERTGKRIYDQRRRAAASVEKARAIGLAVGSPRQRVGAMIAEIPTQGPIPVDEYTVTGVPAAWACGDLIASQVAGMTPEVIDDKDAPLEPQPRYPLLREPEPGEPWEDTIYSTTLNMLFLGNAWWLITDEALGIPTAAKPLLDREVQVRLDPRTHEILYYHVRGQWRIEPRQMIHFKGPCFVGEPLGLSVVGYLRRTFANALAQDQYASETLVTGGAPRGHFEAMTEPDDEHRKDLKEGYKENVAGRGAGPWVIFHGTKWVNDSISPADLQFLESRQYSAREMCTIYGVPPHMVAVPAADSKTYQNANMDDRAFAKRTLSRWARRLAARLSLYLPPGERVRFSDAKVTEPSDLERVRIAKLLREMKSITRTEIREYAGLAPLTMEQEAEIEMDSQLALPAGEDGGGDVAGGLSEIAAIMESQ